MTIKQIVLPALLSVALLAIGCADETETDVAVIDTLETQDPMGTETAANNAAATLNVYQQQPYGEYIVDGDSMSLYMFKADTVDNESQCYDACAEAWPPLITQGDPQAGDPAVQSGLVDTIQRRDGSTQVTYGGWPLYYFAQDQQPGDVQGQDVMGFGAEWYLVSPAGNEVHADGQGS